MRRGFKMIMQQFADRIPISERTVISDRSVSCKLADGRVLEILLKEAGHGNRFEKLVVRIIHPQNGEVAKTTFRFQEFLQEEPGTNGDCSSIKWPYVWVALVSRNDSKATWYNVPTEESLNNLMTSVRDWVGLYE